MDLSRIRVAARMRSGWQAIDLGFVMARAWWKPLFLSWLIPSTLLYMPLALFFHDQLWVAIWVVWWFKPLFDRGPIYIASRALFDVRTPTFEWLKALPGLYKIDCLPWLTWRRFSVSRSYDLPVTVLEKLRGKARQSRLACLHHAHANAASWLTMVCIHLEWFLALGAISLALLMIPEEVTVASQNWFIPQETPMLWVQSVLSYFAMVLVAPLYTMAGFALYISRRIDLEGWDIEIRFRHLAASQGRKVAANLAAACLICLLGFTLLSPQPGLARENVIESEATGTETRPEASEITPTVSASKAGETAKRQILEILAGDDFHERVMTRGWRLKKREAENPDDGTLPEWFIHFVEFLEQNDDDTHVLAAWFGSAAKLLEFLMWIGVAFLAIYLFIRYREGIAGFARNLGAKKRETAAPNKLFGLDVRPESLPEDLPEQVRKLWQAGAARPALSLLYRATLSKLIHISGFVFHEGHTEGECLAIVKQGGEAKVTDYTAQLTLFWQALAYGHHVPEAEAVDALLSEWEVLFQHGQ